MKLKKKLIIAFSVVFAVIALVVILCFTLFALNGATVNIRTSTTEVFPSSEEIISSANLPYGTPVFFLSKKNIKNNIESANPYVEVINIETVFPNSLTIHVRERQKVYAFEHDGNTYFCDDKLVVLDWSEGAYTSLNNNPIKISGLNFGESTISVGDKMPTSGYMNIYDSLFSLNLYLYQQQEMIESIEFGTFADPFTKSTDTCAVITMFDGHIFKVYNATVNLDKKMEKLLVTYSNIYSFIGQPITKNSLSPHYNDNWTEELLDSAYVVIVDNYTNTKECIANILPQDEDYWERMQNTIKN